MAVPSQINIDTVLQIAQDLLERTIEEYPPEHEQEIKDHMRNLAEKEIDLANCFPDISALSDEDLRKVVQKYLTDEDKKNISKYDDPETFIMVITDLGAFLFRAFKKIADTMPLKTSEEVLNAITMQMISVLIEIYLLMLSLLGINPKLSNKILQAIMKKLEPIVRNPAFRKVIDAFIYAWKKANSVWEQAKAIWDLYIESIGFENLRIMEIYGMMLSEITTLEMIKYLAMIAATLVVSVASNGIVLIAKIALTLDKAYNLLNKGSNLLILHNML